MKHKQTIISLFIIALIGTLTQISTDIYTPSLPAIAQAMHATLGQSQMTMAFFMMGVAVTTLIYGPLSEVIGRRKTIMIGLSIALLGTILCIFADDIHVLQGGRFIQGCGLGACASLWRSIFRDIFSGEALARVASYLVVIITLSVMVAPVLGGYFQQYFGWHASFMFLFVWTVLVFALLFILFKETSQHHSKDRLSWCFMFKAYKELLSNRTFMGFSLMVFFTYGGLLAWLTAGPMVLIHGAGVSPVQYGYLLILTGLATGISGVLSGRLVKKIPLTMMVNVGIVLMSLSGMLMLLTYSIFGLNVAWIMISAVLFIMGSTFIFMNCFALGFEDVGHIAGYAGSLYSFIQLLGGAVFGFILSHLNSSSPVPLASLLLVSGVATFVVFKVIATRRIQ